MVSVGAAVDTCTFGSALTLVDDVAISRALSAGTWPRLGTNELTKAMQRDMALTDHRWRGVERRQSGPFVPGDVVRMRALAAAWVLELRNRSLWAGDGDARSDRPPDSVREDALLEVIYGAVPYFLPAAAAHGIMASHPPDAELRADLRLPYPAVAVFFGAEFAIPPELRGGEEVLLQRHRGGPNIAEVIAGQAPWDGRAPEHIRFPTLAAYRGQELAIVGVLLTADDEARLGDLVAFVVSQPRPAEGRFSVVEALLSRSRLRPLIENLAAAVAWGDWQPPTPGLDLPPEADSAAFRAAVNRGAFRRQEPRGVFGGIRVLDAPKMFERRAEHAHEGPGRQSPATHLRRGHWRRQRVGPRDGWRYEPRFIAPIVVNPGAGTSDRVTVYRLPVPPPAAGGQVSRAADWEEAQRLREVAGSDPAW